VIWDPSKLKWKLLHTATPAEYLLWEDAMERGFSLCNLTPMDTMVSSLIIMHVDWKVYMMWGADTRARGVSNAGWEDSKKFFHAKFLAQSEEATAVVSVQPVSVAMTKSFEEKQPDIAKVVVCAETVVEKVKLLSELNMQFKRVHDTACITVDKGQRWSLFQTQCMIKGKACKLMVDGGSYCNGISKAVVATLGLSTWCIPEPKHVAWLNSYSMLNVTHKVRVPFIVGDYIYEVECDVFPLEVCGLLLGRPWQYDHNVTHAGRANTYSFVNDGKQRTLKPMQDDQIKSDVELVVYKEELRKA
jgi:hypothetical protein